LAIGATLAVAAVIHGLSAIMHARPAYDYDNDFEEEEDDLDPIVMDRDTFSPKPDFSKVGRNDYCPCGSGRTHALTSEPLRALTFEPPRFTISLMQG